MDEVLEGLKDGLRNDLKQEHILPCLVSFLTFITMVASKSIPLLIDIIGTSAMFLGLFFLVYVHLHLEYKFHCLISFLTFTTMIACKVIPLLIDIIGTFAMFLTLVFFLLCINFSFHIRR
jgi:hypothetical protein